MANGTNTNLAKINKISDAHDLLESFGIEVELDGSVDATKSAILIQKLIRVIDETKSLKDTFATLVTSEPLDYEQQAQNALALNEVIDQHIDVTLNRHVVLATPEVKPNDNARVLEMLQKKKQEKNENNINKINQSSNVSSLDLFKSKKTQKELH